MTLSMITPFYRNNSMYSTILYLASLAALLACTPAESFQSNHVVRPLTTSLEREVCNNKESHYLKNQNAFVPSSSSSSRQGPSITSYRYSAVTSPVPITASTTRLNSFYSKSTFRTADTTSVDTATRTPQGVSSFSRLVSGASLQVSVTAKHGLKSVSQSLSALQWPTSALEDVADQVSQFVLQYWWSFPLFLALVPVMTTYVLGTGDAIMPHWWPCTKMDHIVGAPDAFMVVGCFLFSNIAYFASGAFLVKRFPFVRPEASPTTTTTTNLTNNSRNVSDTVKSKLEALRIVPTRQTWLGLLMLSSGLISTIFHTEQALGSYALANSLCYIDHAIAGTATFYFFHTCNAPSKRVWALGLAGLACLSIPHPAYAWLHSLWHFLSAGAATLWALESFGGSKRQWPEQTDKKRLVEQITLPQLD